jgi:hypothetical protein
VEVPVLGEELRLLSRRRGQSLFHRSSGRA